MATAHIETITSVQNALLKSVRKAIAKGSKTDDGLVVAEGFHLLEEARRSACVIEAVIATDAVMAKVEVKRARSIVLPPALFREVSGTETPQGVIALVRPPLLEAGKIWGSAALVLVLDAVQDPGNAGTIVRSAEAFGATAVMALKGTADFWNPKVVRASAGSVFRVPLLRGEMKDIAAHRLPIYAAVGGSKDSASGMNWAVPCVLIVGSEAHGVSRDALRLATPVGIPTRGVESLNAGVAAAVLLYEAARQRGWPQGGWPQGGWQP